MNINNNWRYKYQDQKYIKVYYDIIYILKSFAENSFDKMQ